MSSAKNLSSHFFGDKRIEGREETSLAVIVSQRRQLHCLSTTRSVFTDNYQILCLLVTDKMEVNLEQWALFCMSSTISRASSAWTLKSYSKNQDSWVQKPSEDSLSKWKPEDGCSIRVDYRTVVGLCLVQRWKLLIVAKSMHFFGCLSGKQKMERESIS